MQQEGIAWQKKHQSNKPSRFRSWAQICKKTAKNQVATSKKQMVLVDPFHGCKEVDAARGKGSRPLKEIFRQFSQKLVPAGWGSDIIEDCVERFLVLVDNHSTEL